jgi:hypothetical protein
MNTETEWPEEPSVAIPTPLQPGELITSASVAAPAAWAMLAEICLAG